MLAWRKRLWKSGSPQQLQLLAFSESEQSLSVSAWTRMQVNIVAHHGVSNRGFILMLLLQRLKLIEDLGAAGTLDQYYLFHAAQADLLRRLNRREEAAAAYQRALLLTTNHVERQYLRKRLAEVTCRRGL